MAAAAMLVDTSRGTSLKDLGYISCGSSSSFSPPALAPHTHMPLCHCHGVFFFFFFFFLVLVARVPSHAASLSLHTHHGLFSFTDTP